MYIEHIRRYATESETLSLGRRSLCLAWSQNDTTRFKEVSSILGRYYRKKYVYEEPTDAELERLCRRAVP